MLIGCICFGLFEALFFGASAGLAWLLSRVGLWRSRRACSSKCCHPHDGHG